LQDLPGTELLIEGYRLDVIDRVEPVTVFAPTNEAYMEAGVLNDPDPLFILAVRFLHHSPAGQSTCADHLTLHSSPWFFLR
jgi:hypothetical protein